MPFPLGTRKFGHFIEVITCFTFPPSSTLATYINSPKERNAIYLFWGCPVLFLFIYFSFTMWPINDAHHKKNKIEL